MPQFIIERDIPGVEKLSPRERKAAALKSNRALNELGPEIQWIQSYLSEGKSHCVYIASSEELIHEHARRSKFPVTRILEVKSILHPTTAELPEAEKGVVA